MKTHLVSSIAAAGLISCSFPALAQDSMPAAVVTEGAHFGADDVFLMSADVLLLVRKGEGATRVEAEMTLPNATRILPDGTVVLRDGSKRKLLNQQMLTMTGEVVAAPSDVLTAAQQPTPAKVKPGFSPASTSGGSSGLRRE